MTSTKFKPIVLSGMRSTGELHLGHYFGVIQNWLELQELHPCYFFAADWHALTTDYHEPALIAHSRRDNIIDWIACGLNPDRTTLYIQSQIKEELELNLYFSMITPVSWLERNPTYKEQQQQLSGEAHPSHAGSTQSKKDTACLGFLSYPVLQAADIAIVRGSLVPVGEDQLPHLELNRELIRRFTHLYKKEIFPEPKPLLTKVPKLLGIDNRKMSKSYGNAIMLGETSKSVEKKVKSMITDPGKIRLGDPGNPHICNVFSFHQLLEPKTGALGLETPEIESSCTSGALACGTCKSHLAQKVNAFLEPIRNKKAELTARPDFVDDVIATGCNKARTVAKEVLEQTREALKI